MRPADLAGLKFMWSSYLRYDISWQIFINISQKADTSIRKRGLILLPIHPTKQSRDGGSRFYGSRTTYIRIDVFRRSTIHVTLFITHTGYSDWRSVLVQAMNGISTSEGKLCNKIVEDARKEITCKTWTCYGFPHTVTTFWNYRCLQ